MIEWDKCAKHFIREAEMDEFRIKSMVERALQREKLTDNITENETNISFIAEGYYEVIKELLVAYMLNNCFRARNHQCLIAFFHKNNPEQENITFLIERLLYFRNRLNYYGESIPAMFFEKNKADIKAAIKLIKKLIKIRNS